MKRPILLGHRGARGERSVAENTLESFDLALAQGCDGFEFDVRLSGDDQAVICHDAEFLGRCIVRSSAERLALPLLAEVLQRYHASAYLDIELKVPGIERRVLDLLRSFPLVRGGMISSFLPEVLTRLRALHSPIPLGLICESKAQFRMWPEGQADYAVLHRKLLSQQILSSLRHSGKGGVVWTVNSVAEIQRFAEWGVDGIIGDYPARLAGVCAK
jgi:glycerophosphoryl diester phosphodiesterase